MSKYTTPLIQSSYYPASPRLSPNGHYDPGFPGALWHITSRGNKERAIFLDDADRLVFLGILAQAIDRFRWILHAWTLMTNHDHLVLETPEPTLSRGLKWLLGTYVGWFNKLHRRTGHLFGDRFHSDLIEKESYLTEAVSLRRPQPGAGRDGRAPRGLPLEQLPGHGRARADPPSGWPSTR